jgi:hypothetical protein
LATIFFRGLFKGKGKERAEGKKVTVDGAITLRR